jgi:prevent-host-death family protein
MANMANMTIMSNKVTGKVPSFNVAEAKSRLSELLGRVAYGGASFVITRRGRPMALLVPVEGAEAPHRIEAGAGRARKPR